MDQRLVMRHPPENRHSAIYWMALEIGHGYVRSARPLNPVIHIGFVDQGIRPFHMAITLGEEDYTLLVHDLGKRWQY